MGLNLLKIYLVMGQNIAPYEYRVWLIVDWCVFFAVIVKH